MPSGKTHDTINLISLPVLIIGMFALGVNSVPNAFVFAFGFIFGTFMCGPDLDTFSKLHARWGLFRFIWIPYRKFFPHRSFFTHGFLIGDAIRVVYLIGWVFLLFVVPDILLHKLLLFVSPHQTFPVLWSIGIGVFVLILIMSVLHIIHKKRIINFRLSFKKHSLGIIVSVGILGLFVFNLTPYFSLQHVLADQFKHNISVFIYFPIGIMIASTLHSMADILVSSIKKRPVPTIIFLGGITTSIVLLMNL